MANEQNKFSHDPSSTGGSSSTDKSIGNRDATSAAAQRKKDTVSNTVGASPGSSSGSRAEDTGKSLLDQAKNTAGQAYEAAAGKATSKLEEQKTTLSGGLVSVADSFRQVGQNLKGADVQDGIAKYTAEYSDTAAQKIEQVANYFESRDIKEMFHDVESFARRNPAIFIGGAFALGIIAARFLKSSSPKYLTNAAGQNFGSERRQFKEDFNKVGTRPSAGALH